MPADIALLLHMHQPDYRHPRTGEAVLPWVRLHAVRGYLDVADRILAHGVGATVNLAPSLVAQLQDLSEGRTDTWARLARVPAEELEPAQADFIRERFVCGHPAMRTVSPRYLDLARRALELDHPAELRDLQVWSNLAWMGGRARRDPFVTELFDQDRDFSHAQLEALLDRQHALCGEVLQLWRQLPSVSCSPLCHPILPLLVDFEHARRALPEVPVGSVDFAWPADALRQLIEGRELVEGVLGRPVQGLWPSEGSVSPEVLELVEEAGFTWLASDEGVLRRSERTGPPRRTAPWDAGGLRMLFRATGVSDIIGFQTAGLPPRQSLARIMDAAQEVVHQDGGRVVPVILDGENPWESHPDAGVGLMDALFSSGRVGGMEALLEEAPAGRITTLHTGSWINADLAIWAGDVEDRQAWRRLSRARAAWERAGRPEAAWAHVAAAEGSDWFWWFGPEFDNAVGDLFAELFEAHLQGIWAVLGPEAGSPEEAAPHVEDTVELPPILGELWRGQPWSRTRRIVVTGGGSMAAANELVTGGLVAVGPEAVLVVWRLGALQSTCPPGCTLILGVEGLGQWRWPLDRQEVERAVPVARLGPGQGSARGMLRQGLLGLVIKVEGALPGDLGIWVGLRDGLREVARVPRRSVFSLPLVG